MTKTKISYKKRQTLQETKTLEVIMKPLVTKTRHVTKTPHVTTTKTPQVKKIKTPQVTNTKTRQVT